MNRTNIGKQLSGFVGQDVSRQFAQKPRKLYAEGETVEVESEETITKTFPNGKTWTWNPSIESEPDPETGRTRKFDKATGKMIGSEAGMTEQLTGLGGVNLFGQATLGKAQEEAAAAQQVPVSVSIVPRNDDPITDPAFPESKNKSSIYNINQLEGAGKTASLVGKAISAILPGGTFLHDPLQKGLIGEVRKEITHPDRGVLEKEQWEQANIDPATGKKREPKDFDRHTNAFSEKSKKEKKEEDESELGKFLTQARNLKALAEATGMGRSFGRLEGAMDRPGWHSQSLVDRYRGMDSDDPITEPSLHLGQTDPKSQAIVARASPEYQSYAGDVGEEYFGDRSYGEELGQLTHEAEDWDYFQEGGSIPFAQGGGLSSLADKNLAPGSFVLSADVISGIGDGSSESGLRRLNTELGFPITPNGVEGRAYGGTISGTVRGPGSGLDDLNQTTIAGKQAAALANQEVVVSPGSVTRLAQMLYPDKKMSTQEALKSGQEALYNFQKNIRQQKADSSKGGKQPGPLKTGKGGLRDLMMAG